MRFERGWVSERTGGNVPILKRITIAAAIPPRRTGALGALGAAAASAPGITGSAKAGAGASAGATPGLGAAAAAGVGAGRGGVDSGSAPIRPMKRKNNMAAMLKSFKGGTAVCFRRPAPRRVPKFG